MFVRLVTGFLLNNIDLNNEKGVSLDGTGSGGEPADERSNLR